MGSIPVRVTMEKRIPHRYPFFLFHGGPYVIEPTRALQIKQSTALNCSFCTSVRARYGDETLLRRLLWRPCRAEQIPVRVTRKQEDIHRWVSSCFFVLRTKPNPLARCTCVQICKIYRRARGSHTSPRSARGIAVARRYTMEICTDLEICATFFFRAPHSRTCLPLGMLFLLITLVVLIARIISSHGNIPLPRYAPESIFSQSTSSVSVFSISWWPVRHRTHSRFANRAIHSFELLILHICTSAIWGRTFAPPSPVETLQGGANSRTKSRRLDARGIFSFQISTACKLFLCVV